MNTYTQQLLEISETLPQKRLELVEAKRRLNFAEMQLTHTEADVLLASGAFEGKNAEIRNAQRDAILHTNSRIVSARNERDDTKFEVDRLRAEVEGLEDQFKAIQFALWEQVSLKLPEPKPYSQAMEQPELRVKLDAEEKQIGVFKVVAEFDWDDSGLWNPETLNKKDA